MKTMITKVFTSKNHTESIADAYSQLQDLNPLDPYKKQKAAGSLGGASHWKFIELNNKRQWVRIR
jgi:hypothetical protein